MADKQELMSLATFNLLSPRQQGYASYMQSALPGSKLPKKCPYPKGDKRRVQWEMGERAAVLEVQDNP